MKINLRANEKLLREGAANMQRGAESVGGRLFLTDQRLLFQSHSFNVQTGATEISIAEISETELCWTKFLGIIPLIPNCLLVHTISGAEFSFILFGRKQWAAAISTQRQLAGS